MQEYVDLASRHMEFLVEALDGDPAALQTPSAAPLPTAVDPGLVKAASAFLRNTNLPFEPRKQWPTGGLETYGVKGRIGAELQARPGRALCRWGDPGWGEQVRRGKYDDGRFDDELVEACANLVRRWRPQPAPEWLTCIPSLRHPGLVPSFAHRLAEALGLPFDEALISTRERPEQKTMANSIQQARNLDGSLAISAESLPIGPVLLVDDMVDSRWT